MGGQSPAAVERAARLGGTAPVPAARPRDDPGPEGPLRRGPPGGLDTSIPLFREAFVAPTTEEAFDAATGTFRARYASYLDRDVEEGDDLAAAASGSEDAFRAYADDRSIVGSPEADCATIERYDEAWS